MTKRDTVIIAVLVAVLAGLNVANYIKRENLRRNMAFVVEESQAPISINGADSSELEELPGIGPVMARRIIEYRNEHGFFDDVEELKKVKGIGDKSLDRIRPFIRL